MPRDEEFAEFDMDEAEFDARMEAAEAAELVAGPVRPTVTARTAHGTFRVTMPAVVSVSIGEADSSPIPSRRSVQERSLQCTGCACRPSALAS